MRIIGKVPLENNLISWLVTEIKKPLKLSNNLTSSVLLFHQFNRL